MADRLDLRTALSDLYSVGAKAPALVDVPDLTVIAIDGEIRLFRSSIRSRCRP